MSGLREPVNEDFSPSLLTLEIPMQSSTIRPTQSSKVPVSLRSLFPEEEPPDTNESPATPIPSQYPPTLAPPPSLIPMTSGQNRTARRPKRLGEADNDDLQHTHRPGFVFPPRPKQTTDIENPPEPKTDSPKVPSPKFPLPSAPHYPPLDGKSTRSDDGKAEPVQTPPVRDFFRAPIERKRSKSSTTDTSGRIFPSPDEYRFPTSNGLPISAQRPLHLLSKRSRRSPTLDSLDRIHTSPTHQSTHSLDGVPSGRTSPSTSRSTPSTARPLRPTLNGSPDGSHSPTKPPLLKPSLIRQASVAVMETVPSPPLLPPVPPLVRQRRRSGNSVGGNGDFLSPNVPGLKDVLKVRPSHYCCLWSDPPTIIQIPHLTSEHQLGMADLLPPSPSAFGSTNTKTNQIPSPLNPTPGNNPLSSSLSGSLSASTKSASRSRSRSPPPPLDFSQPSPNFVADGVDGKPPIPQIRPLDLGSLMGSRDDTHAELAHIVEDLAQWLAVVENGLSDLLGVPAVDTIEEEQEEQGGYHDEFSSGLEDRYETQNDILSTPHAFLSHSGLPA